MCLNCEECPEGHKFRIKELQCEVCGEISLLLKDKYKYQKKVVEAHQKFMRTKIEAGDYIMVGGTTDKLIKLLEATLPEKVIIKKPIEPLSSYDELQEENQKLKEENTGQTERIYELMADSGKLVQENRKLKEEIKKLEEQFDYEMSDLNRTMLIYEKALAELKCIIESVETSIDLDEVDKIERDLKKED